MKSNKRSLKLKSEMDSFYQTNAQRIDPVRTTAIHHFKSLVLQNKDVVKHLLLRAHWTVSKLLYLNEKGNRMYTHLMVRNFEWKGTETDNIMEVIGAKINDQWYYLFGTTTYLPRESYKSDLALPLSYEEMDFLMNKGLFPAIVSCENGEYHVNANFFKNKFRELDDSVLGSDEEFMRRATSYQPKTIPQSELDRIRKKRLESKPPIKHNQFFLKRFFKKKKLFDSKAWKDTAIDALYE
ncbi:MAG: hypothetical protein P1U56_15055 [Saprospiraceae bacterium]|nr:hypothetical protein [Saprospiraceae bacterium]